MSLKNIVRIINYVLYAIAVLVPLIFIQRTMFPFVVVKTAVFQSLAEIIIFLWIGLAFFYPRFRPRLTPFSLGIIAFFLLLTFSSLTGPDWRVSLWSGEGRAIGLVALWHFLFLFFALKSLKDEINWRRVWLLSLGASTIASLGALLTPFSVPLQKFFLDPMGTSVGRPGSTFGNPTFLAGYLLFNFFIALWLFFEDKGKFIKVFSGIVATIDVLGILRTQTRGDIAGLGLGILVFLGMMALRLLRPFELKRSVVKNFWLISLAVILIFCGIFFSTRTSAVWKSIPGLERWTSLSSVRGDLTNRLLIWRAAWNGFKDRPIFGWGWENFNLAFERYYNPQLLTNVFDETNWDKPHNVLIESALTGGALGFFAYLFAFGALIYETWRLRGRAKFFAPLMAGALGAYFVRNLVVFDTIGTYLMFFLLAAYLDGLYENERSLAGAEKTASAPERNGKGKIAWSVFAAGLIVSASTIYFINWRIFHGVNSEYWGPNYFLNHSPQQSLDSFRASLNSGSPYHDIALLNFAGVVKQSYGEGVVYPDIKNLQAELNSELEGLIARHKLNYFHYVFLAEFKNAFYQFNPDYLKQSEELEAQALVLSPARQQTYYAIAKTKILEGDYRGGYDALEKAVDLNPKAGDPHFYFGLLAYQQKNIPKGDEEIAAAKSLGRIPRTPEEAVALGSIVGDLKQDYAAAADYYKLALSLSRDESLSREIRLKLAIAYLLGGRTDEARDVFVGLGKEIDLRKVSVFEQLKPYLDELHVPY